jgi:hypothetical protein
MIIRVRRYKRKDERTEIGLVVKRYVRGVFISMTERSLTMSASTVLADSKTYQLVWLVVTRTGLGSRLGIDIFR